MPHSCPAYSSANSELRAGKRRSGREEDNPVSLNGFVSEVYLPYAEQYKKSWAVDERIARQHISPAFGERAPADISRKDVEAWLQGLSRKGLAPATCNRILYALKSICSLAVRHDLFPSGNSPSVPECRLSNSAPCGNAA